jgi:hypothetical protein
VINFCYQFRIAKEEFFMSTLATARRIRNDLDALITQLESETSGRPEAPPHLLRRYQVLREVEDAGGVLSGESWRALGQAYDFDARGLGGFFVGNGSMEKDGNDRALTAAGRGFLRWFEGRFHVASRRRARRRAAGQ